MSSQTTQLLLLLVLPALFTIAVAENDCLNPAYSVSRFNQWNITRPPFLAVPAIVTGLTYCKMFNNQTSCCNSTTDNFIGNFLSNYKAALVNLTSAKIKKQKDVFEQYANVDFTNSTAANGTADLINKLNATLTTIRSVYKNKTQDIVLCVQAALRVSTGIMCNGCNPSYKTTTNAKGNFILSEAACKALANSCLNLVLSSARSKDQGIQAVMNLTSNIAQYVGEDSVNSTASLETTAANTSSLRRNLAQAKPARTPLAVVVANDTRPNADISNATLSICDSLNRTISGKRLSKCIVCRAPPSEGNVSNNTNVNVNDTDCLTNDLVPSAFDEKNYNVNQFIKRSQWGYIAAFISIKLNGTDTIQVKFILADVTQNNNMFQLLQDPKISLQKKVDYLNVTITNLKKAYANFISFSNSTNGNNATLTSKNFVGKDLINALGAAANGNNSKKASNLVQCAVKQIIQAMGPTNNPGKSNTTCNVTVDYNANTINACGNTTLNVTKFFDDLDQCSNVVGAVSTVWVQCANRTCLICLDTNCFSQDFSFRVIQDADKRAYNSTAAAIQFNADPRVDPQTGRRIGEYVLLPNVTNATNLNFTTPCNGIDDCKKWFCITFLRGPVARLEKVYNPQNLNGTDPELDAVAANVYVANGTVNVSASVSGSRLLQSTTDSDISSTGGIQFNEIASQSALDTSVTVDGVTTSSAVYDASVSTTTGATVTNSNTFAGSLKFVGIVFGIMFMLVNLI